jgi:hypothetical protein
LHPPSPTSFSHRAWRFKTAATFQSDPPTPSFQPIPHFHSLAIGNIHDARKPKPILAVGNKDDVLKTNGSIETGKLADFVILDKDPTAVDPETIDKIKVVKTIKENVTIFDIADMKKSGASIRPGDRSELAFTRAMLAASGAHGHDRDHQHAHGGGCLCGFMAKLGTVIADGND